MNPQEARDLAGRIRSEGIETKVGQVNGLSVVHVIVTVPRDDGYEGSTRKSYDIRSETEWSLSDLRPVNRPRPSRTRREKEQLADEQTVAAGLSTVYEP